MGTPHTLEEFLHVRRVDQVPTWGWSTMQCTAWTLPYHSSSGTASRGDPGIGFTSKIFTFANTLAWALRLSTVTTQKNVIGTDNCEHTFKISHPPTR